MTEMRATGPRSTLALDAATGGLRMGSAEQRIEDPADTDQVYAAYLSLLYAVRGARRGKELPLRSADLDSLLAIVGEDPEQIERRLVELMGCTAEEASLLRRVLLRHRARAASVGAVAGLSLVALLGPSVAGAAGTSPEPAPPGPSASAAPEEQPPLTSYLTTDDGRHVPVPPDWDPEPVEAPTAPATAETEPSASPAAPASAAPASAAPSPTTSPNAAPSGAVARASGPTTPPAAPVTPSPTAFSAPPAAAPTAVAPASAQPAPADDEVVLGPPRAPIDRPGWSPEDDVVLGEPRAPIDRPGWSPEDEVVLGEPRAPIDRIQASAPDADEPSAPTG